MAIIKASRVEFQTIWNAEDREIVFSNLGTAAALTGGATVRILRLFAENASVFARSADESGMEIEFAEWRKAAFDPRCTALENQCGLSKDERKHGTYKAVKSTAGKAFFFGVSFFDADNKLKSLNQLRKDIAAHGGGESLSDRINRGIDVTIGKRGDSIEDIDISDLSGVTLDADRRDNLLSLLAAVIGPDMFLKYAGDAARTIRELSAMVEGE